jgi:hypothetical protein
MALPRRQRLEGLTGWSWNTIDDRWELGFSHLKKFTERNGHCRVPKTYVNEEGYRLGSWVSVQRRKKEVIDPDRLRRLEALPGWSWDVYWDRWEEGFASIKRFVDQYGHSRVSKSYKTADGSRLGEWVKIQRQNKDKMDPVRRQCLEALPNWSWDPFFRPVGTGFCIPQGVHGTQWSLSSACRL